MRSLQLQIYKRGSVIMDIIWAGIHEFDSWSFLPLQRTGWLWTCVVFSHVISQQAFWEPLPDPLTSSRYSSVTTWPLGVSWSYLSLANCVRASLCQETAGSNNIHLIFWCCRAEGCIVAVKNVTTDCRHNHQSWKAVKHNDSFPRCSFIPVSSNIIIMLTKPWTDQKRKEKNQFHSFLFLFAIVKLFDL